MENNNNMSKAAGKTAQRRPSAYFGLIALAISAIILTAAYFVVKTLVAPHTPGFTIIFAAAVIILGPIIYTVSSLVTKKLLK